MLFGGTRRQSHRVLVQRVDVAEPGPGWLDAAVSAVDRDGVVILTGTGLGAAARGTAATMLDQLPTLLPYEDELTVYARGHLRQYPPVAAGSGAPGLFAHPAAVAVYRAVLGEACYLANYMGHTVMPESSPQPLHVDWGPLWPELGVFHPPFLLAYNIALVDTGAGNGGIELWPGTHRILGGFDSGALTVSPAARRQRQGPGRVGTAQMSPGDILIRDVRVWHRGTHNPSDAPRPIVFGLVAAGWYRYRSTRPMLLSGSLRPAVEALDIDVACEYTDELDPVALSVGADD
jgi:hypothetical protein